MRQEMIFQKNHEFFCLEIIPFILGFDFLSAITESFKIPVKKLIPRQSPSGCLIISSYLEKGILNFFVERLNNNLPFKLSEALKSKLAQEDFSNQIKTEVDGFLFKFEILKYEIPSRPNISWVNIKDLEEIYGYEKICPIVDLKITSPANSVSQ